jgi:hypothetical protein
LTILFLLLLGAAWATVFLPAVMRARQTTPLSSAERFKRRMQLIAPRASRTGRWVVVPEPYERIARSSFRRGQRRRTRILLFLGFSASLSGMVAIGVGGPMWEVHLLLLTSLAVYVTLLLETKRRRLERSAKVHSIRRERARHERLRDAGGFTAAADL